ncbi:MAG: ATP-binding cassette domain-containing protein [Acidobacteria bacterium]|nr:MAG: ATP-binding cassette domain-containing protein [Acidobacteriota bacterium]
MVEVSGLTKRFDTVVAVDGVSFTARPGEILGVLGPNGAGKTTTLRIVAGFLEPSSGRVAVDGIDVLRDSLAVRRRLGFLPENNPLYPEMRVGEYLRFRAALKGIPRRSRDERIAAVAGRCGVAQVLERVIGRLSRGYRQRVGLADALLADPPVVILDEPTVGLDPNQVREVRGLVRELGRDRTVLLSSHVLAEVEQTCDRVVIFHRGRIVAEDSTDALRGRLGRGALVTAEIAPGDAHRAEELAAGVAEIRSSERLEDGWLRLTLAADSDPREQIFRRAALSGVVLRELTRRRLSLEEVFHELTADETPRENAGEESGR